MDKCDYKWTSGNILIWVEKCEYKRKSVTTREKARIQEEKCDNECKSVSTSVRKRRGCERAWRRVLTRGWARADEGNNSIDAGSLHGMHCTLHHIGQAKNCTLCISLCITVHQTLHHCVTNYALNTAQFNASYCILNHNACASAIGSLCISLQCSLFTRQWAFCILQKKKKLSLHKEASQSEERYVGGTVPSPHCHDKHVHPLQNALQNNAMHSTWCCKQSTAAQFCCWWGSNKSDNNNVGVAQMGAGGGQFCESAVPYLMK